MMIMINDYQCIMIAIFIHQYWYWSIIIFWSWLPMQIMMVLILNTVHDDEPEDAADKE